MEKTSLIEEKIAILQIIYKKIDTHMFCVSKVLFKINSRKRHDVALYRYG